MEEAESNVTGLGCSLEYFRETEEMEAWITAMAGDPESRQLEAREERMKTVLDLYQERPHMLDPHLPHWLDRLFDIILTAGDDETRQAASLAAHHLVKVRGFKVIVRHFPHQVQHVERVMKLLETQDPESLENTETKSVLLLWMSMLVLIPFHLSRFDPNMMDRILAVCRRYLKFKFQRVAAYLAAKFLTRPEIVKEGYLAAFLDEICRTLNAGEEVDNPALIGQLTAVAAIFKNGARSDLLPFAPVVFRSVLAKADHPAVQVRKLVVKTNQRIGLTFLKARVASWRYQRGSRSLILNLTGQEGSAKMCREEEETEEEDYDVPDEIEEVIENLLTGLRSAETVVRWSAAKGIGRVTARLPKELADDVLGSLLQLFSIRETDGAWHGGCLALAELARRGLLLPGRLPEVVAVIERASNFDERRGTYSVGSHVRDAACYVCWALARAFAPRELAGSIRRIAVCLLTVAVFDREVNCRRAAAAAFQENVGRQGAECLPNAIEILTTLDYHAVGSRAACYTSHASTLANLNFGLYGRPLVEHLLQSKVGHWDSAVRELASLSFERMSDVADEMLLREAVPRLLDNIETGKDLFARHGSILCLAKILSGLSKSGKSIKKDPSVLDRIRNVVASLEKRMALRGSGGELTRSALTVFIEDLSESRFPCHDHRDVLDRWKLILDENLLNNDPGIQERAAAASASFVNEYSSADPSAVIEHHLSNLHHSELSRRGSCLAIGCLPAFALRIRLHDILSSLIACAGARGQNDEKWAEGRRDALKALTNIVKMLGVDTKPGSINETNIVQLYDCYLNACEDYTVDRRGDVGAWVREAAMTGLLTLTMTAAAANQAMVPAFCIGKMMAKLAKQSLEKIDRTRGHAAKTFATILFSRDPEIPDVPHRGDLVEMFPERVRNRERDEFSQNLTAFDTFAWNVESETFPIFARLVRFSAYRKAAVSGLVVSVGGLTERLVLSASDALTSQLNLMDPDELKTGFCAAVLDVFRENHRADRVVVPMLKFIERLVTSGSLTAVFQDPAATFSLDLFHLIKKEVSGCNDPAKLMTVADSLCSLLETNNKTARAKCLTQLCIFLCHRFPRVRRATASKLFEALLTCSDLVQDQDKLEEIQVILSQVQWDQGTSEDLRPSRNRLCELLGIHPPAIIKKPPKS